MRQTAAELGELALEDRNGRCPCGEPASFGQIWNIEWYDRHGLVEDWITIRLCKDHRARKPGEL